MGESTIFVQLTAAIDPTSLLSSYSGVRLRIIFGFRTDKNCRGLLNFLAQCLTKKEADSDASFGGDENKGDCPHHAVTKVTNSVGLEIAIVTVYL